MGSSSVIAPENYWDAIGAILDAAIPPAERLLLFALLYRTNLRPNGVLFDSINTLSRRTGVTPRHVRRLLRSLETRGLIESNERPGMTTEYRIRWERLLNPGHQCPGSDSPSTSNPGHSSPLTPDADDRPGRTPASAVSGHPCPPNIPLNIPQEPSPSNSDEWREVEGELEKEGVAKATEAVTVARERGYTPERAMLVIQHYRTNAGAWKSGALFHRLTKVGPIIPIELGWAKPDAKFVRQREAAKEAKRLAAEAQTKALAPKQPELTDAERQVRRDDGSTEAERRYAASNHDARFQFGERPKTL